MQIPALLVNSNNILQFAVLVNSLNHVEAQKAPLTARCLSLQSGFDYRHVRKLPMTCDAGFTTPQKRHTAMTIHFRRMCPLDRFEGELLSQDNPTTLLLNSYDMTQEIQSIVHF